MSSSTSTSSSFSRSRTRLGKYELGKTLGEGSFAKVKYAKNVQTGENVAIKIINRDRVLRQNIMEQVLSCPAPPCIHTRTVHGYYARIIIIRNFYMIYLEIIMYISSLKYNRMVLNFPCFDSTCMTWIQNTT